MAVAGIQPVSLQRGGCSPGVRTPLPQTGRAVQPGLPNASGSDRGAHGSGTKGQMGVEHAPATGR